MIACRLSEAGSRVTLALTDDDRDDLPALSSARRGFQSTLVSAAPSSITSIIIVDCIPFAKAASSVGSTPSSSEDSEVKGRREQQHLEHSNSTIDAR
jgi:hypothetical protein